MNTKESVKELIRKNFITILNNRNMKDLPMSLKKGWYKVAIRFSLYQLREELNQINSFFTSEEYYKYFDIQNKIEQLKAIDEI